MQCTGALTSSGHGLSHIRTIRYNRTGAPQVIQCVVRQGWVTDLLTQRDPDPAPPSVKWTDTEVLIVWTGTVPKQGRQKLDSSCQTYHADVNQNSQTFRSWNNSFWDAGMKMTCISILTLTSITNLCLYNIHEQQIHKIKFMINIYLLHAVTPRCRNMLEMQVP